MQSHLNGIDDADKLSAQTLREVLKNLRMQLLDQDLLNNEAHHAQAVPPNTQARFFDLAPMGYITTNAEAVILQANLSAAALLNLPRAMLIGKALTDLIATVDLERFTLMHQRALTDEGTQSAELRLSKSNGDPIWVAVQAVAVSGEDGSIVTRMVVSDITLHRHTEARLQANKEFYRVILDSVPAQIALLDRTGRIIGVNQPWRDTASANSQTPGAPASNTQIGANYLDVCRAAAADDADGSAALAHEGILSVIKGNAPGFEMEYPCHIAGQQRWFSMKVAPLNMQSHAVVVTHSDITRVRELDLAAKQASEDKFRLVADNTSDGIVIFSADRHIEPKSGS